MKKQLGFYPISVLLVIVLSVFACVSAPQSVDKQPTFAVITQLVSNTNTAISTTREITPPTDSAIPQITETPVQQLKNTATTVPTTLPTNLPANPLQVHFIDVGQGDSILIISPSGETTLIDGGETDTGVVQYLKSSGINHINLMIATHPHSDHIGGLVQVLQEIPVDEVVTNGQMHTTSIYEHFLDAIESAKANYIEVKRGDTITLGNLKFDVLNPVDITSEDLNNNSIVLRLVYGKIAFLFAGDAQEEAEASLLSSGLDLWTDILKVGHHGSHSSSTPDYLEAVKPAVAIYSAGAGNDYGHPHGEAIGNLAAAGAQIYGTDINGTIIVTSDGTSYTVQPAKQSQPQTPPVTQSTGIPQPATLSIEVVSLTSPIAPGDSASLTIKTLPGAECTITVYYKSGPSQAKGLGPQTANNEGNVTWSWKVGSNTTPGTWRIVVTANFNGQTISTEIPFEVQK